MSLAAPAQQNSFALKSSVKKKSIRIRIAPVSEAVWKQVRTEGLIMERITLPANTGIPPAAAFQDAQIVTTVPLKPLPVSDSAAWKKLVKENPDAVLAYQFLYENKSTKQETAKVKQQKTELLFGLTLLAADLDAGLADALGLLFTDSLVDMKPVCAYRVRPAKNIAGIVPAVIVIDALAESIYPEITGVNGKFRDRTVKLNWPVNKLASFYSGYSIERSSDSIHFERVNKTPVIHAWSQFEKNKSTLTFNDTFPENGRRYWYRVRGINLFGEICNSSNVISGTGYAALHAFPVIDSVSTEQNVRIRIRWHLHDPADQQRVREFYLLRAEKENGKYVQISKALPNSSSGFTDEQPLRSNFYKVAALSFGGDTVFSFSAMGLTYDETPPAIPQELRATVNDKGLVKLTWKANTENDLRGYRVFKSNSLREEFVEVSRKIILKNEFTDTITLHSLTAEVYYRLQAVDHTFNNSKPGEPVKVLRPDTIAPVAPVIKTLCVQPTGISMRFIPSTSEDVVQYLLYRKTDEKTDTLLRRWPAPDTLRILSDTLVHAGHGYRYRLMALDKSDNASNSNQPYIFYETGSRKKMNSLEAEADRAGHYILLRWKAEHPDVYRFVIYKAKKGEPLRIFRTLKPGEVSVKDTELYIGNHYVYRIKAILTSGAETEWSDLEEVEY
ncbi:MAG: fibronectin type III domain-containing protein [Bacteroidetes bacterium]|nr:MAG: fibronectin type III domain-containing protein [Bacteroidota bacterium]